MIAGSANHMHFDITEDGAYARYKYVMSNVEYMDADEMLDLSRRKKYRNKLANYVLGLAKNSAGNAKIRCVISQPNGRICDYKFVPRKDAAESRYPIAGHGDNYALFYEGYSDELNLEPDNDIDDETELKMHTTEYVENHMRNKIHRDALNVHGSTFADGISEDMMTYIIYGVIAIGVLAFLFM